MIFFKKLFVRSYYIFANLSIKKKSLVTPDILKNTKNIFIYFDYEREFGGHSTKIDDKDIIKLLNLLEQHRIKTTWFTVGRIFEKYPDSISSIISNGHEIGSHSYYHTPPLHTKRSNLSFDFRKFAEVSEKQAMVKGFHSPNGAWSLNNFEQYLIHNFKYDVVSCRKSNIDKPWRIRIGNKKSIVRLQTIGDDWRLYGSNSTQEEALEFFLNYTRLVKTGEIVGVGFHPWILFSDINILKGFEMFIEQILQQKNVRIETALSYVNMMNGTLI